jgi:hypothetical protein
MMMLLARVALLHDGRRVQTGRASTAAGDRRLRDGRMRERVHTAREASVRTGWSVRCRSGTEDDDAATTDGENPNPGRLPKGLSSPRRRGKEKLAG